MEGKLRKYCREVSPLELKTLVENRLKKISPTMEYVRNLILDVKLILRILLDEEFQLKEEARKDFICALLHFAESKKMPFVGLWNDYKVVRFVKEKHRQEIERYFENTPHFLANYF